MSDRLRVTGVDAAQDGRFARFELIGWWDQQRLAAARVLVIGAGVIGNELIKNLALLGVGRIWIDGAIERLDGVARVFDPALGPCYECTMSDTDWKLLEARRSCALLTRQEMEQGKVPTTPTTASVIAGIQCQEAVKHLHGLETLSGRGFVFEGTSHQSYVVTYTRRDDCPTHDTYEPILVKPWSVATLTVGELLEHVRKEVGDGAVIELNHDVLRSLECPRCQTTDPLFASLGKVTEQQGRCPQCGEPRVPHLFHTLDGSEGLHERTLAEIGVPPWDIVGARRGMQQVFFEFAGDRTVVLGPLEEDVCR